MDRKQIIEKLKERGYMAEEDDVIKNGVKIEGICIFNESPVAPVIYTEEIIAWAEKNKKGIDSVADRVIRLYEKNKKAKFDIEKLTDLEWVKTRLRVELQKKSTEELVKKDCEGNLELVDKLAANEVLDFYGVDALPELPAKTENCKKKIKKNVCDVMPEPIKREENPRKMARKKDKEEGMAHIKCSEDVIRKVVWTFAHTLSKEAVLKGNIISVPEKYEKQVKDFFKTIKG